MTNSTAPVTPAEMHAAATAARRSLSGPAVDDRVGTKRRAQTVALDLFSANGYDSTSMRQIAEALGVTKAALYYHFAGKEDIVRSLLDDFLHAVDDLVDWTRSTHPEPAAVLLRWAGVVRRDGLRLIRFVHANQRIVRDLQLDGGSMRERMEPLADALAGVDPTLEGRIRARLAMLAVQGVGAFSAGLDGSEDELFDIGLRVAQEILAG